MDIRKAMKGILFDTGTRDVQIGFNDGDETEFTVRSRSELIECWQEFCKENGFKQSSVDYVESRY
jgi:hypothetical protein